MRAPTETIGLKRPYHVACVVMAVGVLISAPFVVGALAQRGASGRYDLAAFVAVVAAGHVLMEWDARRKRQRVFGARAPAQPIEIFATHYAHLDVEPKRFLSYWNECARILEVPPDVVLPTDRFSVEFAPAGFFDGLGHPLDDLVHFALRGRRRDPIAVAELNRIKTFGELVCWLAQQPSDSRPSA